MGYAEAAQLIVQLLGLRRMMRTAAPYGRIEEFRLVLGPVDGFNQDKAAGEADECGIALGGLFATQGDALEPFQLADGLFDAGAGAVEQLREESGFALRVLAVRDHRRDAARAAGGAVRRRIVALVGDGRARRNVGADVERCFQLGAVAGLAAGQMEGDRQTVEIRLKVDLAREPSA